MNFAPACGSGYPGPNFANPGFNGIKYNNAANTNGGRFPVSSTSPVTPSGISIISENNIEGSLMVTGNLPILAAVTVNGEVPTSGSASTTYGCGNSNIGIENITGGNYGCANVGLAPIADGLPPHIAGGWAGPAMAPGCGYGIY